MPLEVRVSIGHDQATFPEGCVGPSDLTTCPEIAEHARLVNTSENIGIKRAIGQAAKELGERACNAPCPGLIFADSDSGFTWIKRCPLTNRIERSN